MSANLLTASSLGLAPVTCPLTASLWAREHGFQTPIESFDADESAANDADVDDDFGMQALDSIFRASTDGRDFALRMAAISDEPMQAADMALLETWYGQLCDSEWTAATPAAVETDLDSSWFRPETDEPTYSPVELAWFRS